MRDMILVKSDTDRDPAKSQAFMAHESLGARLKALKMAATDAPDAIDRDQALVSALVSAIVAPSLAPSTRPNPRSDRPHSSSLRRH